MLLQAENQKWVKNGPFLRRLKSNGDTRPVKLLQFVVTRVVLNGGRRGDVGDTDIGAGQTSWRLIYDEFLDTKTE